MAMAISPETPTIHEGVTSDDQCRCGLIFPPLQSPHPWHCDHATTAHDHLGLDSQRNLTECCWPFENLGSRHSDISLTSSFGIPVGQNGCKKHVATTLPVVQAV